MQKITIITIHKGPIKYLKRTIESVLIQNTNPNRFLIITPNLPSKFRNKYKRKFMKFIVGKDKSIYNAMNLGISLTKKENILFLNSGDIFFNKNCIKIINKKIIKNPKKINIFKVVLKYKNTFYYPRKNFFLDKNYLPHPGFVRPAVNNKNDLIKFDENFKTISDGIWMRRNMISFKHKKTSKNIVIHNLGGISTVPTIQLIKEKIRFSKVSFFKELIKIFLFYILSNNFYYKCLYFSKFQLNDKKK